MERKYQTEYLRNPASHVAVVTLKLHLKNNQFPAATLNLNIRNYEMLYSF